MATGNAEIVGWPYVETAPNTDITQYIALTPWVAKEPRHRRKVRARGDQGRAVRRSERSRDARHQQQFTNLNPALKDKVLLPRLGTAINLKEMNHTMEMMQKYGLLKTPVDLSNRIFTP